jgi:hypothetical protein
MAVILPNICKYIATVANVQRWGTWVRAGRHGRYYTFLANEGGVYASVRIRAELLDGVPGSESTNPDLLIAARVGLLAKMLRLKLDVLRVEWFPKPCGCDSERRQWEPAYNWCGSCGRLIPTQREDRA